MWDIKDACTLLDRMCSDGQISSGMLKTIKKICKQSPESIKDLTNRIWHQISKPKLEEKLVALKVLDELFKRSATVRNITLDNFRNITNGIFLDSRLSGNSKTTLIKESCFIIKQWHESYSESYPKLQTSYSYLKAQRVDFENGTSSAIEVSSPAISVPNRLSQWVRETIDDAQTSKTELENLVEIILPVNTPSSGTIPSSADKAEGKGNDSQVIQIELSIHKIRIKRDDMTNEIENAIKPIVAGLEKKITRLSSWIQGEFIWEDELLSEMIQQRKHLKTLINKVADIKFYDDSDDDSEGFEEVLPDRNEMEISYISQRLLNKDTPGPSVSQLPPEISPGKLISNRNRISIHDLEQNARCASEDFVDTRNVIVSQLSERHFQASSDIEPTLDAAMAMSGRYYSLDDIASEEIRINRTCRASMPDGSLCRRMDRKKCPFHGPIVPRDIHGILVNPVAAIPTVTTPTVLEPLDKKPKRKLKKPPTGKQRLSDKLFKRRKNH